MIIKESLGRFFTGSTVVGIRTLDEVYIGADSKVLAIGESSDGVPVICKIRQFGSLFSAAAGLLHDSRGTFSLLDTMATAQGQGGSLLEIAGRFEGMISRPLMDVLQGIKTDNPDYYRDHLEGKKASEILIAGIEELVPKLSVRCFVPSTRADQSLRLDIERRDCPGPDCPTGMTYCFLGNSGEINSFLDLRSDYAVEVGWVNAINHFIGLEALSDPHHVSLPVDILKIDRGYARWIQKKPECPEIQAF